MKAILQANKGLFPHHRNVPNLNFVKGNLLQYDWTRGSVVFTNATCFNAEIMKNIYNKAILLPKGSFFINTTLSMPKEYRKNFIALTPFDRMMSWGKAKIYIFRKK